MKHCHPVLSNCQPAKGLCQPYILVITSVFGGGYRYEGCFSMVWLVVFVWRWGVIGGEGGIFLPN